MLDEIKQKQLEMIANHRNKNEKLSFNRKIKKLEELVEALRPTEEKILELFLEKQPIMDDISKLRNEMLQECTHPLNYLIHKGDHILCKFCDSKISLPKVD